MRDDAIAQPGTGTRADGRHRLQPRHSPFGQRRQALRVRARRAGHRHRQVVAGRFALGVKLALEPPDRRMPSDQDAHAQFRNHRHIVAALDMRPFMNHDAIEFVVAEIGEQRRRDRDDRWPPGENRGRRHRGRDTKPRRSSVAPHPMPVREARFDERGERLAVAASPGRASQAHALNPRALSQSTAPQTASAAVSDVHHDGGSETTAVGGDDSAAIGIAVALLAMPRAMIGSAPTQTIATQMRR